MMNKKWIIDNKPSVVETEETKQKTNKIKPTKQDKAVEIKLNCT